MRSALVAATIIAVGYSGGASAQILSAPVQKIGVAKVTLSDECEVFASRNPTYKGQTLPTAGFLAPILGGLVGDVAGAGLNAIATALESASQERAIGAAGRTNFEFYALDAGKPMVALPRLGTDLACLTIEVPGEHVSDADGLENWPPAGNATMQLVPSVGALPARLEKSDQLLIVGSHDADGKLSHFSNYGAPVAIAAPGCQIRSWPTVTASRRL